MRRGKPAHPRTYIEMRIEQLKQERTKSNGLWKSIDELRYVLQVIDKKDDDEDESISAYGHLKRKIQE